MKVLFVTRGFPSKEDSMSGNYEAVQAKALAAKGLHVSVICVYQKSVKHLFLRRKISHKIIDGVDVYECTQFLANIRFIRRINKYLRKRAYKQVFCRSVKDNGVPNIIHGHIISISSYAAFLKDEYGIPFVITEHWTKTNVTEVPEWLRIMSEAYPKADKVICVSQALATSLKRNFHVDSIVINNMVSDMFFQSIKMQRNDNTFRFIAIGAFRKNKGFDLLVESFAKGYFPQNVTLDIVGDGEEHELVENIINEYDVSKQVRLLGTKTPEEINELLCNSDCFVLSSRLETFAIVVIEAMAKGLPVIATRSGGPETFLLPEHGMLIDKENVEQLTQAMRHMIEHYQEYNQNDIRKYCYDHFSQDVIANQIIDVYNQVLSLYK